MVCGIIKYEPVVDWFEGLVEDRLIVLLPGFGRVYNPSDPPILR